MRTDHTSLCTRCALRFAPADRCPSCGKGRGVVDLRTAPGRELALRRLRREPWWYRKLPVSGMAYGFGLIFGSPAVGLGVFAGAAALGLGALAPLVGAAAGLAVAGGATKVWRKLDANEARARVVRPQAAPSPAAAAVRTRVQGILRVRAPIAAPLTGTPCAAFRVRGVASGCEMDDGGGVDFEVVPAGSSGSDETVVVELGAGATIALPTQWTDCTRERMSAAATAYLEERGCAIALTELRWEQGLLGDGDAVVVEGTLEERTVAEGYRGARVVRVLRELPGSPLIVSRP